MLKPNELKFHGISINAVLTFIFSNRKYSSMHHWSMMIFISKSFLLIHVHVIVPVHIQQKVWITINNILSIYQKKISSHFFLSTVWTVLTLYITVPPWRTLLTGRHVVESSLVAEGSNRTLGFLSRSCWTVGSHWTDVSSGSICWWGGVSSTWTHVSSTTGSCRLHQTYRG